MGSLHTVRFPGETEQYRQARDELVAAEVDLRRQLETIAAQRRLLPLGGEIQADYEFEEWDERSGAPRRVLCEAMRIGIVGAGQMGRHLPACSCRPGTMSHSRIRAVVGAVRSPATAAC